MTDNASLLQQYDHRLMHLVQTTGDIAIATDRGVPSSTVRGWLSQSQADVVSLQLLELNTTHLQQEVIKLRRRNATLNSLLRLAIVVLQVSELSHASDHISDGRDKKRMLRAIQ